MIRKKILCAVVALMLMFTSVSALGAFTDVPQNASYAEAVERISALGIVKGMGDGSFQPGETINREQFATLIVKAAGFEELAQSLAGTSIFPDIDPNGWSVGYINAALNKGYIAGMADGKFHPEESITFAQACTILVRALGYTDQEITGLWPRNFIEKAKTLGLAPGLSLSANDALPRWAAAVMIDRLLVTNVKTPASGTAKTFADSSGLYTDCIVLANSQISSKLTEREVLTDKGTYYIGNEDVKLEVGNKYKLVVKNDVITNAYKVVRSVVNISVESAVDTKITYKNAGKTETMTLPEKTIYYYQGVKQNYENLKNLLQGRTSIVLSYNDDKTGFECGIIVDPVYSQPHIVSGYGVDAKISGGLNLSGGTMVKNGKLIGFGDLEDKDVIYQISDIWNTNKYFLVVQNKVDGKITAILPDKFAPKTVQINDKDYELGKDFTVNKVNATPGSFKVGDDVTLLLGSDGRAVDILNRDTQDNSNFAFVVNTGYTISSAGSDHGKIIYNVKLLLTDGSTATYNVDSQPSQHKGKLVIYQRLDDKRVYLEEVEYVKAEEHMFSTDQRLLDDTYVAENVKIFNLVSNDSGAEAQVKLVDWNEIPRGMVQANKVLFINESGVFKDINVMVTNDLFDEKSRLGVVKKISGNGNTKNYTLLIDGKEYTYSGPNIPTVSTGAVFKVKMGEGKVDSLIEVKDPEAEAQTVQAVDSKRVMINNRVYWFRSNAIIYKKDSMSDTIVTIGTEDIDLALTYGKVAAYIDKPQYYGGRLEVLVLTE